MIPPNFVQDLLSRVDIVDIVGRHVQLKKTGANLSGLCPFHAEKTPSFTVSPSKQFYHCFGCGASGDAIRFLTEHTGAGFREAVEDLAQQVGMKVPQDDVSPERREREQAMRQQRNALAELLGQAAEFYRRRLKDDERAIGYLKQRGLTGEIAARFGLGYAPEGWRALAGAFAHYDDPRLEECGLVVAQASDAEAAARGKRYDRFRDRIMFPIRSVHGAVIGFGGRVLDAGEPKYLNSPETALFSKGHELYGLFEARAALRDRGYALVVEGYMDVVALAQTGFANAVATLGTACTADHVRKLFRFTDSVIFSFDGDAAGRRAALRAMQASLPLAQAERTIKFLFLPADHDPDSFVREFGAEAFEARVAQAVPLSRWLVDSAAADCDLDTAEGRARFLTNAKPYWSTLPEGALKLQMLAELAAPARLDSSGLFALWQGSDKPGAAGSELPARRSPYRTARSPSRGAANLLDRALWLLAHRSSLWASLDGDSQNLLAGQAPPYGALFGACERILLDHGQLTCSACLNELSNEAGPGRPQEVVKRVAAFLEPDSAMDFERELRLVVDRLRLQAVEEELKHLFDSGPLTSELQDRGRQLLGLQARLKAQFAATPAGP